MSLIHFYLCQANGRELRLDLPTDARIHELKQAVANSWQVPTLCQKFVCGTEVLKCKDFEKLSRVFEGDAVTLTVVLDTEAASILVTQLQSTSAGKRVTALEGLADLGPRIGNCHYTESDEVDTERNPVIQTVRALIETDEDPRVRRAAAHAIPEIATADDDDTIELLIRRSNDEQDPSVHKAVMIALGKLAGGCNSRVFKAVVSHLKHADASIRQKGLTALSSVATKGDRQSVIAARELLDDTDSSVRWEALHTLMELTLDSDKTTIAEIAKCLDDKCSFVRGQARALMQNLSPDSVSHLSKLAVEFEKVRGIEMPMEARSESQSQASTVLAAEAKDLGQVRRPLGAYMPPQCNPISMQPTAMPQRSSEDSGNLLGLETTSGGSNACHRNAHHCHGCQENVVRDAEVRPLSGCRSCWSGISIMMAGKVH